MDNWNWNLIIKNSVLEMPGTVVSEIVREEILDNWNWNWNLIIINSVLEMSLHGGHWSCTLICASTELSLHGCVDGQFYFESYVFCVAC